MNSTYNSIFIDAGITVSENMLLEWEEMDNKRKQEELWKQKEETKLKRKTLRRRNIKQQQAFVHSKGQQCKSGAFHENSSICKFSICDSNICLYIFSVYYKTTMHFY